jgi:hypothetical protein
MSITDKLQNFTTSLNIQGKYEDPHARTNWQGEMDKLELAFKEGRITLPDYQVKKSSLMRIMAAPPKK